MTIAVGFNCSDGILLASETLLWILERASTVVAFGGAGTEAGLRRTRDEIDRKIPMDSTRIRAVDAIDNALKKVHDKLPDFYEYKTHALVVIRTSDGNQLYENSGGLSLLSTVDHPCQVVGSGAGLGWYFAGSLFESGMTMEWAKVVAAHLIRQCKIYVEGCGGPTNIVLVPHALDKPPVFIDDETEIQRHEGHLALLDDIPQIVLPSSSDPNSSDLTLQHRLDALRDAVKKIRGLAVARMSTIPSRAKLHPPSAFVSASPEATITDPILPPEPQKKEGE